jgi:hypothetical protein
MANLNEQSVWEEGIRQLEVEPAQGGPDGVMNIAPRQLANRTAHLKAALTETREEMTQNKETLSAALADVKQDLNGVIGRGGFIDVHDFGDPDDTGTYPTREDFHDALTEYALAEINGTDPLEIINGTNVTNSWNGNVWQLTNTPDTDPPVFDWADRGNLSIAVAAPGQPGIVAPGPHIHVNPVTGEMTFDSGILGSAGAVQNRITDPDEDEVLTTPFYVRLDASGANLIARLRVEGVQTNVSIKSLSTKSYAAPVITNFFASNSSGTAAVRWETPSNYVHHFELSYGGQTYKLDAAQREYTGDIPVGTELTLRLVDIAGISAEATASVTDYLAPELTAFRATKEGSADTLIQWDAFGSIQGFRLVIGNETIQLGPSVSSYSYPVNAGQTVTLIITDTDGADVITESTQVTEFTPPSVSNFNGFNPSGTAAMQRQASGSIDNFEIEYEL